MANMMVEVDTGVLFNQHIPTRIKGKILRVTRPNMTYGAECWPIRKQHIQKKSVAEMKKLIWMCGKARTDKNIKSEMSAFQSICG